ncbi:MFS transporter [Roseomonas sp. HJA6]|uniref:MFS transporter n=1 Tax=Roseomonas alba TaxID=2846776 RepID=A0ABS7A366_9PROT|nr:MFS transporter [Neoroseomonas alba]MBW6396742.1 MFS transporter [Neoroseomonas alba]
MRLPSSLTPLRHHAFAWLWFGNAISAIGTWIQSTASAWVMTMLAPDPLMVSLILAAAQLPILVLALPAGALADRLDRKRLLVWSNLAMLAASGLLAALQLLGLVDAWLLLLLTALLACFTALNSPAWSSSVPLLVPRAELPQALVLNSVGFNLARAVGPALGGVIVAGGGAAVAFGANALSFAIVAVIIGGLLVFPASTRPADLPPEPLVQAMRLGLRYAAYEPSLRAALFRSAAFFGCASAVWALLPLYVHNVLGLAATSFGLLLASMGAGAVVGGLVMPRLRERYTPDTLVMLAGVVNAAALIPIAVMPGLTVAAIAMFVFGMGWIAAAASLQSTVQLACAPWVQARGLAIYQAVYNGGMGFGAIGWGWLGMHAGVKGALLAAGLGGIVIAVLARSQQLPSEVPDPAAAPQHSLPEFAVGAGLMEVLRTDAHPVLVSVAYVVGESDIAAFRRAMQGLRQSRHRDGATDWTLVRDIGRPEIWVEAFRLPDWSELRRAALRFNALDDAMMQAALAFHRGDSAPEMRIFLAVYGTGSGHGHHWHPGMFRG